MPGSPLRRGLAVLVLSAVAACGTTVPQSFRTGQGSTVLGGVPPTTSSAPPTASGEQSSRVALSGTSGVAGSAGVSVPVGTIGASSSSVDGGSFTTGISGSTGATSAPVVSSSTGPIKIGIAYADNGGAEEALGASDTTTVSSKSVSEALVRGINLRGGLNGRKLVPVEYSFNSDDANYSTDAKAACTSFTQDNHVSVVLDNAFGTVGGFRDCLQKAGVLDITAQDEGDAGSAALDPLHASTGYMSTDRTYAAVINQEVRTGYLTSKSKVGVIVENCAEDTNAYAKTIRPLFRRLGLAAPKEEMINCTSGFASAGGAASAISSDILAFRSAGVDRVMFVSGFESVVLLLFATTASSQGYQPGYLLSSLAEAQALASQIPSDQRPQINGVGNSPILDVDGAPESATDKLCLSLTRSGGVTPSSYQDGVFIFLDCGPFLLVETAMRATHGNAAAAGLAKAIAGLGTSFKAPSEVGSATFYSSSRHDGPSMVQVFHYVTTCSCMRYTGSPQPS